jgi:hypothetical protein
MISSPAATSPPAGVATNYTSGMIINRADMIE